MSYVYIRIPMPRVIYDMRLVSILHRAYQTSVGIDGLSLLNESPQSDTT